METHIILCFIIHKILCLCTGACTLDVGGLYTVYVRVSQLSYYNEASPEANDRSVN